ncbi:EAL domain-containing protein, partial [Klebsiella pneumoniae]
CDPVVALARLRALADLGIRIALDDFGTGHSSLAHLQRFPISVVKIDRSFVQSLDREVDQAGILVRTMIQLSHGLGHRVVAEGVETPRTAEILDA